MKNKRILAAFISFAMILSSFSAVFAAENDKLTVMVDDRTIYFADQEPYISENNDTLIPLRGVLEAMGAKVEWDAEERSVFVKSYDNITRLMLYIDNPVMTKYTLKTVMTVDSEEITLSTAPRIDNDRTMVPLRVISENMGAKVEWDEETRKITIITKEYDKYIAENTPADEGQESVKEYNPKENLPYYYIEADKTTAAVGEKVTVNLKLANAEKIEEGANVQGVTATLLYDDEKLNATESYAVFNDEIYKNVLGASNPNYLNDAYKFVYIVYPTDEEVDKKVKDGTVATFSFEIVDEGETEIALTDRWISGFGGDNSFLIDFDDDRKSKNLQKAEEIFIDTTPIVINAAE